MTDIISFVSPSFLLPFRVFLASFLGAAFTFFSAMVVFSLLLICATPHSCGRSSKKNFWSCTATPAVPRRQSYNMTISFVSPIFLLPFRVFLGSFFGATFTFFFFSAIGVSSRARRCRM